MTAMVTHCYAPARRKEMEGPVNRLLYGVLIVAFVQVVSCDDDAQGDNPYAFGDAGSSASEADGDSEDDDEAKCEAVKELLVACYDAGCESSDSSFCQCWNEGQDLDMANCVCIPQDMDMVCVMYNLDNFSTQTFDCDAAMTVLDNQCDP